MGLDEYGFSPTMIANTILVNQEELGDSAKELEEAWLDWLHFNPFDAPVATRLASIMRERLSRIDREKDGERGQILDRKLEFVSQRAERYQMESFIP